MVGEWISGRETLHTSQMGSIIKTSGVSIGNTSPGNKFATISYLNHIKTLNSIISKVGSVCHISWNCPGHVLRMGTCPKISVTEWDGWLFCIFCSVTCLKCILAVSHMSHFHLYPKKFQILLIFQINLWKISLIPLSKISFSDSFFAIATPVLIPKHKKWGVIKDLYCKHKEIHCNSSFIIPPLFPSNPGKNSFFFNVLVFWSD